MEKVNLQKAHKEFELWAERQPLFGYVFGDNSLFDKCSSGTGYIDGTVHAAWLGYMFGKYGANYE